MHEGIINQGYQSGGRKTYEETVRSLQEIADSTLTDNQLGEVLGDPTLAIALKDKAAQLREAVKQKPKTIQ